MGRFCTHKKKNSCFGEKSSVTVRQIFQKQLFWTSLVFQKQLFWAEVLDKNWKRKTCFLYNLFVQLFWIQKLNTVFPGFYRIKKVSRQFLTVFLSTFFVRKVVTAVVWDSTNSENKENLCFQPFSWLSIFEFFLFFQE